MTAIRIVPADYKSNNSFERVVCLSAKPTMETRDAMALALGYTENHQKIMMNMRWFMVAIDFYKLTDLSKTVFPYISSDVAFYYEWSAASPISSDIDHVMISDLLKAIETDALQAKQAKETYQLRKEVALARYRILISSVNRAHENGCAVANLGSGRKK